MPDEHITPPSPTTQQVEQVPQVPRGMVPFMMGPPAPRIYANSFQLAATNADIVIELRHLGVQVTVLSISFALAKTLQQKLSGVVQDIEKKLGQQIPTTDDFDRAFKGAKTP